MKSSRPARQPEGNLPVVADFGREICGHLASAEEREWLVTNGIGGFACGTVAGSLTRRYHGLLVAALKPPLGRTLLVSKLEEMVRYAGSEFALSTNRWAGGATSPEGYRLIERFRLEGTAPVWTYACADALLEKRIWMEHGSNTTCVHYTLLRAAAPAEIQIRALVNYRDYHGTTRGGDWRMQVERIDGGLRVQAYDGAQPICLRLVSNGAGGSATPAAEPAHDWYRDFDLPVERFRGLGDREDHLHAGTFRAALAPGESLTVVLSAEPQARESDRTFAAHRAREESLLAAWAQAEGAPAQQAPDWVRQLVLAADQFIVRRPLTDDPDALSVIAGYPWFGDWGRDTMIALPGLALSTGRPDVARNILRTFSRFVDRGMLPNVFPDAGETPEYNTVDAALWYFQAVWQYFTATRDVEFLREVFPVLADIVDWHIRGTRYNIHADPTDGLLSAGEPGVQLTWMDAKVGDWVVTPRIGKPVEINALWQNALCVMNQAAHALQKTGGAYEYLAKRVRQNFQRFWNERTQYCFDVLDGPDGDDASLRPNQIFAVSLPCNLLTPEQQRAVVDVCARQLLTSHGLRSLGPADPAYRGRYGGGPRDRDAVYHQGTVWGWLLGPFALAHLRVYDDPTQAASFLEPMARHLSTHGLGTASEIFDGDPPFTPRGCFAQAWTVAEVLRAWLAIARASARLNGNTLANGKLERMVSNA